MGESISSGSKALVPIPKLCPLDGAIMREDGIYLQCLMANEHRVHISKEWGLYERGERDISWLRWRMKVRLGKIHQMEKHQ